MLLDSTRMVARLSFVPPFFMGLSGCSEINLCKTEIVFIDSKRFTVNKRNLLLDRLSLSTEVNILLKLTYS